MELKKMYDAIPFSPIASLSQNIGAADTTIYVDNAGVFPAGPGLATIGIDENAETIRYTAVTDAALSGCMRGVEGTAKAWPAGENIARNFTAKDWNDIKANIEALHKEMQEKNVPADWSVNAEGSVGFIKNRTHWKEYAPSDLVYLNATVDFKSNMTGVSGTGLSEIVAGKTYIVYWNGSPYECSAYTSNGEVFLGNGTLMSVYGAENTGEPFCINVFSNTTAYVAKSTDTSETVSLKITPPGKVIYHKLDRNYLPDDVFNGSGGGEGGVSSWNDLTDKPFGDIEMLIAAEKTFSLTDATNKFTDLNSTMVQDGQELVVRFDGVRYTCKVKDWGDDIGLATDNYADMMAGTSELPFCLIFKSTQTNISCTSSGEHTASVCAVETVKMPGKYLPEGLPYAEGGMVELLPETQAVEGDDVFGLMDAIHGVEVGGTYTVNYNGVDYECTANLLEEDGIQFVALGDGTQIGLEFGNGEPFFMVIVPPDLVPAMGAGAQITSLDGATSVKIAIYSDGETVHKLDNKYLNLDWLPTITQAKGRTIFAEATVTVPSSGTKVLDMHGVALDGVTSVDYMTCEQLCITVDGVEYICVVDGNGFVVPQGVTTLEATQFMLYMSKFYHKVDGEHTLEITEYATKYNKIPEGFLPTGGFMLYSDLSVTEPRLYMDLECTINASEAEMNDICRDGKVVSVLDVNSGGSYCALQIGNAGVFINKHVTTNNEITIKPIYIMCDY